ncbi:MAG: hypothetical protein UV38_C0001G0210 [candidate division TM6 bacterium GW2011_GWE2_42_60]|nr:MAG: hypothetical protein UV38_C0001G0210 [candidate division TM6 bacterium GW2011_GWE2_42_60]HBY05596.1 RNA-binding protein [Candidatus Dependentiae bacterium]
MVEKLLEYLVKQLVTQPESVMVSSVEADGKCTIQVRVAQQDIARVIGSEGRILRSLRTMGGVSGALKNKEIVVEILK